jgi:UTP-glucose-1-phosphate uridylyltransferase
MAKLIGRGPFHGLRFEGERFDCGSKIGFLRANIAFALDRDDIGEEAHALIEEFAGQKG